MIWNKSSIILKSNVHAYLIKVLELDKYKLYTIMLKTMFLWNLFCFEIYINLHQF
jgi:hypothetical protein